jgi:hypothetical protein
VVVAAAASIGASPCSVAVDEDDAPDAEAGIDGNTKALDGNAISLEAARPALKSKNIIEHAYIHTCTCTYVPIAQHKMRPARNESCRRGGIVSEPGKVGSVVKVNGVGQAGLGKSRQV